MEKSSEEIEIEVNAVVEMLNEIDKDQNSKLHEKSIEQIPIILQTLFAHFNGENGAQQRGEILFTQNIPARLIKHMNMFDFESQKIIGAIVGSIIQNHPHPAAEYFRTNTTILETLVESFVNANCQICESCAYILQECIRNEPLAKIFLESATFYKFFDYMDHSNFDVASYAFYIFKHLLVSHKKLAAEFLDKNYDKFVERYNHQLLRSENFVNKRQAIKLLRELLLEGANYSFMMKYTSDVASFKVIKNFLLNHGLSIQAESFGVFQIFLANPYKGRRILNILIKHNGKLRNYLETFQIYREDPLFNEERRFMLNILEKIAKKYIKY